MSTITKERAQEIFLGNGPESTASEERELARLALASLTASEQEPVYQACKEAGIWVDIDPQDVDSLRFNGEQIRKVYTAPPAPVSVPDAMDLLTCHLDGVTETYAEGWNACRAAMLQGAEHVSQHPELTVWYGSMPESNGKTNWTAILHRKGEGIQDGMTIDRSEYPGRVLYAADRVRYLIGEKADRPCILDYDADAHSGYVKPGNSPAIPDGYALVPVEPTKEMIDAGWSYYMTTKSPSSIGVYGAMLAAAPQQEVK